MDSIDALSRSHYRERRLNNASSFDARDLAQEVSAEM